MPSTEILCLQVRVASYVSEYLFLFLTLVVVHYTAIAAEKSRRWGYNPVYYEELLASTRKFGGLHLDIKQHEFGRCFQFRPP